MTGLRRPRAKLRAADPFSEYNNINRALLSLYLLVVPVSAGALQFELPELALVDVTVNIVIRDADAGEELLVDAGDTRYQVLADASGRAEVPVVPTEIGTLSLSVRSVGGSDATASLRVLPGYVSVLPPLFAIIVALLLRNVIPALLLGIWLGATALNSFSLRGAFTGLLDGFAVFVVGALADADHAAIIVFSMMVGGMVGIITRNGGMAAIVTRLVTRAASAVHGQIAVWLMGIVIFFDDYSNTLVVGNTARALTDRLRISREKLAYIVDSTAAPVVCIALITTWIGYEVSLIDTALAVIPELDEPAYTMFLRSLPYSFYPIMAIFFVFVVSATGRDFGPMYRAEVRARNGDVVPQSAVELPAIHGDRLDAKTGVPQRSVNAAVPIAVMVVSLVGGLLATGEGESLTDIVGSANAYTAMLWASLLGTLTAAAMTITQRVLNTQETVDAWYGGARATLFAMIVLVLAWSLSSVTQQLHTADFLVSVFGSTLRPELVPVAVFVLSAITAFTTGTSWGTMGILMPLVLPLCWAVMQQHGLDADDMHILYSAIACNLAGAVWGDHCSPISDTTVLSSMASGCDHLAHVRTQMPYALLVGTVAVGVGTVPAAFGVPPVVSLAIGGALLWVILKTIGRRADIDRATV